MNFENFINSKHRRKSRLDAAAFNLANRFDRVCFIRFVKDIPRTFGKFSLLRFGFRAWFGCCFVGYYLCPVVGKFSSNSLQIKNTNSDYIETN